MSSSKSKGEELPHWDLTAVYPSLKSEAFAQAMEDLAAKIDDLDKHLSAIDVSTRECGATETSEIARIINGYLDRMNETLTLYEDIDSYLYARVSTDSHDTDARRRLSEAEILTLTPSIAVTKGERGSTVICLDCEPEDLSGLPDASGLKVIDIPAVPPGCVSDPTGVGDAYRAGVIKGLVRGYSWETIGRLASLAATYVIETHGPQSHRYILSEFVARYREHFGDAPELEELLGTNVASQQAR